MQSTGKPVVRKSALIWVILLAFCIVANHASFLKFRPSRDQAYIAGWDNNFYFAWGRSLAMDGDVNFKNDLEFLANLRGFGLTQVKFKKYLTNAPTPTGAVPNKYGIGLGILSIPLILVARAGACAYSAATGVGVSPFAAIYPLAFSTTGIIFGFLGLAIAFKLLQMIYSRRISFLAVVYGAFGLSIGFYIWFENMMSHATGFCFTTLFVATALKWRRSLASDRSGRIAAFAWVMGLVLGFACAIRYTNITFLFVPVVLAIAARKQMGQPVRVVSISLAAAAAGWFIGFLPQLLAWKAIYGTFVTYSYQGEEIYPYPRFLMQILFGENHGLFSWTPLAALGVVGLVLAARRGESLALAGIAVWLATCWIYAGWTQYPLGHAFGMRGFCEVSLFFFLGIGELIQRVAALNWNPVARPLFHAAVIALIAWNIFLISGFRAGVQPPYGRIETKRLVVKWRKCLKQFKADTNLLAMLRQPKHPYMTAASAHQLKPVAMIGRASVKTGTSVMSK